MLTIDLFEKWTEKYKRSINCSNPKGFSQKAHCAGRKKHNESVDSQEPKFIQALRDFLPIAVKVLDLDHIPKIVLKKELHDTNVPTFGRFTNEEEVVYCVINNRHPNDILRTLAHEMAHYAQGQRDELDADSWHTGSPAENQANAQAGVVMREFNKKFPKYLSLEPIIVETADYERDMQSDPGNPIPFPKGTTLVNVSDVYDWYKLGMAIPALDKADPRIFNKGVPHTVFAFGSEEEEHRMVPLLKRLGFTLHDIDKPEDYEKAIRASDVIEHLEQYVAENFTEGKHCNVKNAVPELKAALEKRKEKLNKMSDKGVYDAIDKIMTRIANTYDITGQELHDLWTERYGEIPDTWILDEYAHIMEKQDACYHKVKSRYKVWPSAYASGALSKCRKVGAKNWGNKTKK